MTGALFDTYVAALQHDLVDLPDGTRLIGVVREPTSWFHGSVDENRPSIGPPPALLEAHRDREAAFKRDGMCDEGAHNAAWEETEFARRYREYLGTDEPRAAMADVLDLLSDGVDVALVCYENTDQKRCHRTILREELARRRDGGAVER